MLLYWVQTALVGSKKGVFLQNYVCFFRRVLISNEVNPMPYKPSLKWGFMTLVIPCYTYL